MERLRRSFPASLTAIHPERAAEARRSIRQGLGRRSARSQAGRAHDFRKTARPKAYCHALSPLRFCSAWSRRRIRAPAHRRLLDYWCAVCKVGAQLRLNPQHGRHYPGLPQCLDRLRPATAPRSAHESDSCNHWLQPPLPLQRQLSRPSSPVPL